MILISLPYFRPEANLQDTNNNKKVASPKKIPNPEPSGATVYKTLPDLIFITQKVKIYTQDQKWSKSTPFGAVQVPHIPK